MSTAVRRFVTALSSEGLGLLFQHTGLLAIGFECLDRRQRTKSAVAAILNAPVSIRGRVEAIAGSIISLAEKGDLAERALREVCQGSDEILAVLESDRSLEERIFSVWLSNSKTLDRARNLAKAHYWRSGRYHCGFDLKNPGPLMDDVDAAKEAVGRLVQQAQGGRKAHLDHFSYLPENGAGDVVHHIAVYALAKT